MSDTNKMNGVFQMLEIKQDGKWVTIIDMRPEAIEQRYCDIPARLDQWQKERNR